MALSNRKILDTDVTTKGVVAAPNILNGSAQQNKAIFDRLIREIVKERLNALIDDLTAVSAAGELGASVEGVTGNTVQAVLSALKAEVDTKAGDAGVTAKLALKADKADTDLHFKAIGFDAATGTFTFTRENGTSVEVDTALEKVAVNFTYDDTTEELVLTLADGSTQRISLAALISIFDFMDSSTVAFGVSGGTVTAQVKAGSITDEMLSTALVDYLEGLVSDAESSEIAAGGSAQSAAGAAEDSEAAASRAESAAASANTSAGEAGAASQSAAESAASASGAITKYPYIDGESGNWMVWDASQGAFVNTGVHATGADGEDGKDGADGHGLIVMGLYATLAALQAAHPTAAVGDAYAVGTAESNVLYTWDGSAWVNLGALVGPQGKKGDTGPAGPNLINGSTSTTLTGVLRGNGSNVAVQAVDATPTSGSDNLVTSGGVQSALDGKAPKINGVYYGVCSTAAATAAKVVTISGVTELTAGVTIAVKFDNAQTSIDAPTLNVNSLGVINIRRTGGSNAARYEWQAGEVLTMTYDGTFWVIHDGGVATTTYYGSTKLVSSATSDSTSLALTPYSLSALAETMIAGCAVYSASNTYAVGDRVRYNYGVYECITAITTAEPWTAAHWRLLDSLQEQMDGKQPVVQLGNVVFGTTWSESSGVYTQSVTVTGATVTANSKIDLQLFALQRQVMQGWGVTALWVENNSGTLTAYALGAQPQEGGTIQCTVTEVAS
ncbi:MAG: hypothetical protein IJS55_03330 [Oscillospiraceae bacterium]|nr:hypothetical protein [Oscillospiraceae bacterium]